jgi:hypothetical protein
MVLPSNALSSATTFNFDTFYRYTLDLHLGLLGFTRRATVDVKKFANLKKKSFFCVQGMDSRRECELLQFHRRHNLLRAPEARPLPLLSCLHPLLPFLSSAHPFAQQFFGLEGVEAPEVRNIPPPPPTLSTPLHALLT